MLLRLFLAMAWTSPLLSAVPVERVAIYADGVEAGYEMKPWNLAVSEKSGGAVPSGKCLWFNEDWNAQPWAGVCFEPVGEAGLELTAAWLKCGFVRFLLNVTTDRYGGIAGQDMFQARPGTAGYQYVESVFIDRGRGIDEENSTWQKVLIPLSYWTELAPGIRLRGFCLQTVGQSSRTFSVDEIEYVRFSRIPEWIEARMKQDVAQPWVEWPEYEKLPEILKADRHPPRASDGRFVGPDGRRIFLLNPYMREDCRLEYWGSPDYSGPLPTHGLYDRKKHGWIYDEVPDAEMLCRLGFNSYSATVAPQVWWDLVGYRDTYGAELEGYFLEMAKRVKLPYYVDLVSWPWVLGKPGLNPGASNLPAGAHTQGMHHWVQYRTIGAGRRAWLDMWELYAKRYRRHGVAALAVELMNEPAYMGESPDHRREFAAWLKKRHGTLEKLSTAWGKRINSWEEAAMYNGRHGIPEIPGQYLDFDEYHAQTFADLIAAGASLVSGILPDTLVGLQTMGGYARHPRDGVWKHMIIPHETIVLSPTGGGQWTSGRGSPAPAAEPLRHRIAAAPLEPDLIFALAGKKMIMDNETYLYGQTARATRNRFWAHVLCGLDGLTVFSWSRRGWAWRESRAEVQTEADKFPYSLLNPIARRTEALRGILDFAGEIQPLADLILSKPWGPAPRIGILYDWANVRRRKAEPTLPDKTGDYYAALKYAHFSVSLVPSHFILEGGVPEDIEVLVAAGITHVEPELLPLLERFVRRGGILIVGEAPMDRDLYGGQLPSSGDFQENVLGLKFVGSVSGRKALVQTPGAAARSLPGELRLRHSLRQVEPLPGTVAVLADETGRPVVARRAMGDGAAYYQAADFVGYELARLLWAILAHAAPREGELDRWRLAEITEGSADRLAPNVLISRRSYADHHALLLLNMDGYERKLKIRLPGLTGRWRATEELSGKRLGSFSAKKLARRGIRVKLKAEDPAVVLLKRSGKR